MVDDELFSQTDPLAAEILELLQLQKATLVLAESCTCGLIAATLARIPGMSAVLAGSFVVYQIDSKAAWRWFRHRTRRLRSALPDILVPEHLRIWTA